MSHKPKNKFSPPMVGGSSLLVIFAVLCLTVFTLLALGTVQADSRLSDASVKAVTDYYAADLEAETIFSQLRAGNLPPQVTVTDTLYTYSCPISETQELQVELRKDTDTCTILRWQAVSTVTY